MKNLTTTYLGIPLDSPVILAAGPVSSKIDAVKRAEESGAGAIVTRSLFEEQILTERYELELELNVGGDSFAEALSYFPDIPHGDAKAHLHHLEKMRAAVSMPIIGSLNAANPGSWLDYARQLEGTGIDAIELNIYFLATDPGRSSGSIEQQVLEIYESVASTVTVPVSVKLSPWFTSVAYMVQALASRGAAGVVLFNRFLQPEIDPDRMILRSDRNLSSHDEIRLPLRWVGILAGRVDADLCLNTGVQSGRDIISATLAGAAAVQVAAEVIRHGVSSVATMLRAVETWMDEHDVASLDDIRGKLSHARVEDPSAFERAQYIGQLRSKTGNY